MYEIPPPFSQVVDKFYVFFSHLFIHIDFPPLYTSALLFISISLTFQFLIYLPITYTSSTFYLCLMYTLLIIPLYLLTLIYTPYPYIYYPFVYQYHSTIYPHPVFYTHFLAPPTSYIFFIRIYSP